MSKTMVTPDRKRVAEFIIHPALMKRFRSENAERIRRSGASTPAERIRGARKSTSGFMLLERTLLHGDEERGAWRVVFIGPDGTLHCRHVALPVLELVVWRKSQGMERDKEAEDSLRYRQCELEWQTCRWLIGVLEEGTKLRGKGSKGVHTYTPGDA